jgi:hypothetical protein
LIKAKYVKISSEGTEEHVWEPTRKLNTKKIQQIRAERRRAMLLDPVFKATSKTTSPQKTMWITVHTGDGTVFERTLCGVRIKASSEK